MKKNELINEFHFEDTPVRVVNSTHIPFPGVFHLDGKLIVNRKVYESIPMEDLQVLLKYGIIEKEYHEKGMYSKDPYNELKSILGNNSIDDVLVKVMKIH